MNLESRKHVPNEISSGDEIKEIVVHIGRVFILDEDGIFKEFFPSRFLAPLSNFLKWEERKKFFLKCEVPERLISVLKNSKEEIRKDNLHIKIDTKFEKSFSGVNISCHITVEEKKRDEKEGKEKFQEEKEEKNKREGMKEERKTEGRITKMEEEEIKKLGGEDEGKKAKKSVKIGKGKLVIFMTWGKPKIAVIIEEGEIYGNEKILNFFILL